MCAHPQARSLNISSFPLHYIGESYRISHKLSCLEDANTSSYQLFVMRRPSLRFRFVSDRNHTPLLGAFSQVCKPENVSRSFNH
jgi:hypothetical protein